MNGKVTDATSPARLNDLQDTIRQRLDEYRFQTWDEKIMSITHKNNSIWEMTRQLTRPFDPITAITHKDITHITDIDKDEAMADYMSNICDDIPDETDEQRQITRQAHDLQDRYNIPPNT